jgi:hypothetical protein
MKMEMHILTISEVSTPWAALQWILTSLAFYGFGLVLFRSFPAAEIGQRVMNRTSPRRERINRLRWELTHGIQQTDEVRRNSPTAAKIPLTPAQIDQRRAELRRIGRVSLPTRAGLYFLSCVLCQTFSPTIILTVALDWTGSSAIEMFLTALAYAICGLFIHSTLARGESIPAGNAPPIKGSCPTCGGKHK